MANTIPHDKSNGYEQVAEIFMRAQSPHQTCDGAGLLGIALRGCWSWGCNMEQRVSLITLGVADLKRSTEFYERLGWRRSMANTEGIVFFQLGGVAFALYPRGEPAKDANVPSDGQGFSGITLAYNTRNREEVDSVLAQAQAAGASILKQPQEAFWGGYSGYFADPDGFLWEVAWNPSFAVEDNGSIRIPD